MNSLSRFLRRIGLRRLQTGQTMENGGAYDIQVGDRVVRDLDGRGGRVIQVDGSRCRVRFDAPEPGAKSRMILADRDWGQPLEWVEASTLGCLQRGHYSAHNYGKHRLS